MNYSELLDKAKRGLLKTIFEGYNHRNYCLRDSDESVIVRIDIEQEHDFLDYSPFSENDVLSFLQAVGYRAPRIVYSQGNGTILSFTEGTDLDHAYPGEIALPTEIITGIAEQICTLHNLNIDDFKQKDRVPFKDTHAFYMYIREYYNMIYQRLLPEYHSFYQAMGVPEDPFAAAAEDEKIIKIDKNVLCHCDVHRKNIIIEKNGEPELIDWELSAIADPMYDLAIHFQKMRYSEDEIRLFISAYERTVPCISLQTIAAYRKLEMIRYVISDCVRIVEKRRSGASDVNLNIQKYHVKLANAYKVWGKTAVPDTEMILSAISKLDGKGE